MTNKIIVGTRDSKLALTQTQKVTQKLNSLHPHIQFEVLNIKTKATYSKTILSSPLLIKGFLLKKSKKCFLKKK